MNKRLILCAFGSICVVIIIISVSVSISKANRSSKDAPLLEPTNFQGTLNLSVENLTKKRKKSEWHIVSDNIGTKHMKVIGDTLMVTYPNGSYIPSSPKKGGIQFYAQPKVFPSSHITFGYKVFFPDNFNWVKGGKLPGIWIGDIGANGGNHIQNGASFRVMWRTNGSAEAYIYLPKQPNKAIYNQPGYVYNDGYGESLWRDEFLLQTNVWNLITLTAKMNTLGYTNGALGLAVNDKKKDLDGIIWMNTNATTQQYINGIMMHTFFGGNDISWATPMEQKIFFKDFVVSNT